jgi:hypothetical protein
MQSPKTLQAIVRTNESDTATETHRNELDFNEQNLKKTTLSRTELNITIIVFLFLTFNKINLRT